MSTYTYSVIAVNAFGNSTPTAAAPVTLPAWVAATGVTITSNPTVIATPAPDHFFVGTPVIFTGTGSGSTVAYQYRFWLNNGTTNTMVQDYGVGSTWTMPALDTAGAATP